MILRSGVDLIEIERIANALKRHGDRFLQRIYTAEELAECGGDVYQHVPSFAARFAAKEATAKVFGTGIGVVSWREIEILHESTGQPVLNLYHDAQKLADLYGLNNWSLSISHTHTYAIAIVIGFS